MHAFRSFWRLSRYPLLLWAPRLPRYAGSCLGFGLVLPRFCHTFMCSTLFIRRCHCGCGGYCGFLFESSFVSVVCSRLAVLSNCRELKTTPLALYVRMQPVCFQLISQIGVSRWRWLVPAWISQGTIRRCPTSKNELLSRPFPDVATLYDAFQYVNGSVFFVFRGVKRRCVLSFLCRHGLKISRDKNCMVRTCVPVFLCHPRFTALHIVVSGGNRAHVCVSRQVPRM
jgi:hypothetical protein